MIQGPYIAHHEFRPALSPEDAALLERLVAEIDTAVPLTGARFIVRLPYRVDMIDKSAETEGGAIKWY